MKKLSSIILLILLTCFIPDIYSENSEYGLYIKAFPFNDQEKTSLVLENSQPLKLHKEMTMSFDIYVRKENVFGLVFRILTNKKDNIDMIFTVGENDKRYPMLVTNESAHLLPLEIVCGQWVPVSITLSSDKDEIFISYGTAQLTQSFSISNSNEVKISFGLCPFEGYTLYDVASVNIRDIKILNKKKEIRHWKLDTHHEEQSPDVITQASAVTINPIWLSDIYATWAKLYSQKIEDGALFAFNPGENRFYIVSPDSKEIDIFDPETKEKETIEVKKGLIASNAPNQIFYDSGKNMLVTYNLDENFVSRFSFETLSWDNQVKPTKEHAYWNNSVYIDDSSFISFGGYGFYKYNNELLRIGSNGEILKKSNIPDISPRYSTSTVIVNNTLYIWGGRGNKSGRQELSPRNTYDFYSVNLLTEQVNKLWEVDNINLDFLPSENMVFDPDENCFYVFTTKDGGMLMRIREDKSGFEQMSFPMSEDFTCHYLYTNLYFSPEHKKFYALINKVNTDKTAEIIIYSLDYPPLPVNTNIPVKEHAGQDHTSYLWIIILVISGLIFAVTTVYIYKKRHPKKNAGTAIISGKKPGTVTPPTPKGSEISSKHKEPKEEKSYYNFSKQSICFLGGFHVTDRSGNDITGQFTPMLKFLLILLILSTEKDPKGISGKKLIQILWFDKSEESAKNNRNVYLSKLRTILENIGNVEIINQNGFWSILLHKDISCDYLEAMKLFTAVQETKEQDPTEVNRLLELLLRGVLLPNTEASWVDSFKSDFSNLTIDNLTQLLQSNLYQLPDELKLKISDTLFLHDYINEEALYLKCSTLFNSGKKGIAKTVYDNFCKEYQNLLGTSYRYSLADVISRKNLE